MDHDPAVLALVVAAALHLGFQVTVTVLVYPALGDLDGEVFAVAHERHSRRIAPVVVVVYGLLVLATAWSVVADPGAAGVTAAVLLGLLLAVTGLRAAPLHGRLGARRDPARWRSLLLADRVRLVLAVALLAVALIRGF